MSIWLPRQVTLENPMPQTYLSAVRSENQTVNHLFRLLGARLADASGGRAEIVAPVSGMFSQGGGMVAGGILATLADEAMAHAVLSALPGGWACVTAEMNVRYLRGLSPDAGGDIRAEASIVKRGSALVVAESRVFDTRGRLLATAGATFSILPGSRSLEPFSDTRY